MSRARSLVRWVRERGVVWTALWCLRSALNHLHRATLGALEAQLAGIERRRFLIAPDSVSAQGNTVAANLDAWSARDWSDLGEDWTHDARTFRGIDPERWKQEILETFLHPSEGKRGTTLEIGPGGGRWTAHLLDVSDTLHLADITPRCLDLCRARFAQDEIQYHLIGPDGLGFLPAESIDLIWSYDVFVHVNPIDTDAYLADFAKILRPGGRAVIHHPDHYASHAKRRAGFRSNLSAAFFAALCRKHGLRVIEQDRTHAHKRGDCITVLERP